MHFKFNHQSYIVKFLPFKFPLFPPRLPAQTISYSVERKSDKQHKQTLKQSKALVLAKISTNAFHSEWIKFSRKNECFGQSCCLIALATLNFNPVSLGHGSLGLLPLCAHKLFKIISLCCWPALLSDDDLSSRARAFIRCRDVVERVRKFPANQDGRPHINNGSTENSPLRGLRFKCRIKRNTSVVTVRLKSTYFLLPQVLFTSAETSPPFPFIHPSTICQGDEPVVW